MNLAKVSSAEWSLKGAPNRTMELLPALMLQLLRCYSCSDATAANAGSVQHAYHRTGPRKMPGVTWWSFPPYRHDLEQGLAWLGTRTGV